MPGESAHRLSAARVGLASFDERCVDMLPASARAKSRRLPLNGRRVSALLAIAATAWGASSAACAATRYVATPLWGLGGPGVVADVRPQAINERGEIAALEYDPFGSPFSRATLYAGGTVRGIGPVGDSNAAFDVNDAGVVVGALNGQAFVYSAGSLQMLGMLPGDGESTSRAINASGQIAGCSYGADRVRAFVYETGTMRPLASAGLTDGCAQAVNDLGQVAGYVAGGGGTWPVVWSGATATILAVDDGVATGINNRGDVVGNYFVDGAGVRAFLFSNGTFRDLGALGADIDTEVHDINNAGVAVGMSVALSSDIAIRAAFVWDGSMRNLNGLVVAGLEPGEWLTHAYAINDAGQIAAVSRRPAGGPSHLYRLDPLRMPPPPAEVPVLSRSMLVATGVLLVVAGWAARRRVA
jgi:probable HAF family extracellular repeat protein